jgi:hypothetical protein
MLSAQLGTKFKLEAPTVRLWHWGGVSASSHARSNREILDL